MMVFGEVKYRFRGKVYGCSWRRTFRPSRCDGGR
jgi:hypothetical protein